MGTSCSTENHKIKWHIPKIANRSVHTILVCIFKTQSKSQYLKIWNFIIKSGSGFFRLTGEHDKMGPHPYVGTRGRCPAQMGQLSVTLPFSSHFSYIQLTSSTQLPYLIQEGTWLYESYLALWVPTKVTADQSNVIRSAFQKISQTQDGRQGGTGWLRRSVKSIKSALYKKFKTGLPSLKEGRGHPDPPIKKYSHETGLENQWIPHLCNSRKRWGGLERRQCVRDGKKGAGKDTNLRFPKGN